MRGLKAAATSLRVRACLRPSIEESTSGFAPDGTVTGPPGRVASSRLKRGSVSTCLQAAWESVSQMLVGPIVAGTTGPPDASSS